MKWACPKCGAGPNKHGKGTSDICDRTGRGCNGFLCECPEDTSKAHGTTLADVCKAANCHHCGWGGWFPKAPRKLKPWEKTALAMKPARKMPERDAAVKQPSILDIILADGPSFAEFLHFGTAARR